MCFCDFAYASFSEGKFVLKSKIRPQIPDAGVSFFKRVSHLRFFSTKLNSILTKEEMNLFRRYQAHLSNKEKSKGLEPFSLVDFVKVVDAIRELEKSYIDPREARIAGYHEKQRMDAFEKLVTGWKYVLVLCQDLFKSISDNVLLDFSSGVIDAKKRVLLLLIIEVVEIYKLKQFAGVSNPSVVDLITYTGEDGSPDVFQFIATTGLTSVEDLPVLTQLFSFFTMYEDSDSRVVFPSNAFLQATIEGENEVLDAISSVSAKLTNKTVSNGILLKNVGTGAQEHVPTTIEYVQESFSSDEQVSKTYVSVNNNSSHYFTLFKQQMVTEGSAKKTFQPSSIVAPNLMQKKDGNHINNVVLRQGIASKVLYNLKFHSTELVDIRSEFMIMRESVSESGSPFEFFKRDNFVRGKQLHDMGSLMLMDILLGNPSRFFGNSVHVSNFVSPGAKDVGIYATDNSLSAHMMYQFLVHKTYHGDILTFPLSKEGKYMDMKTRLDRLGPLHLYCKYSEFLMTAILDYMQTGSIPFIERLVDEGIDDGEIISFMSFNLPTKVQLNSRAEKVQYIARHLSNGFISGIVNIGENFQSEFFLRTTDEALNNEIDLISTLFMMTQSMYKNWKTLFTTLENVISYYNLRIDEREHTLNDLKLRFTNKMIDVRKEGLYERQILRFIQRIKDVSDYDTKSLVKYFGKISNNKKINPNKVGDNMYVWDVEPNKQYFVLGIPSMYDKTYNKFLDENGRVHYGLLIKNEDIPGVFYCKLARYHSQVPTIEYFLIKLQVGDSLETVLNKLLFTEDGYTSLKFENNIFHDQADPDIWEVKIEKKVLPFGFEYDVLTRSFGKDGYDSVDLDNLQDNNMINLLTSSISTIDVDSDKFVVSGVSLIGGTVSFLSNHKDIERFVSRIQHEQSLSVPKVLFSNTIPTTVPAVQKENIKTREKQVMEDISEAYNNVLRDVVDKIKKGKISVDIELQSVISESKKKRKVTLPPGADDPDIFFTVRNSQYVLERIRNLKVGFFVIENFNIGVLHSEILIALQAMSEYRLDKIVWVVNVPPPLIPDQVKKYKEQQSEIEAFLLQFKSLFSMITYSGEVDGLSFEKIQEYGFAGNSILKFMELNKNRPIESYYFQSHTRWSVASTSQKDLVRQILNVQLKVNTILNMNTQVNKIGIGRGSRALVKSRIVYYLYKGVNAEELVSHSNNIFPIFLESLQNRSEKITQEDGLIVGERKNSRGDQFQLRIEAFTGELDYSYASEVVQNVVREEKYLVDQKISDGKLVFTWKSQENAIYGSLSELKNVPLGRIQQELTVAEEDSSYWLYRYIQLMRKSISDAGMRSVIVPSTIEPIPSKDENHVVPGGLITKELINLKQKYDVSTERGAVVENVEVSLDQVQSLFSTHLTLKEIAEETTVAQGVHEIVQDNEKMSVSK